jgi:hypothetical protein
MTSHSELERLRLELAQANEAKEQLIDQLDEAQYERDRLRVELAQMKDDPQWDATDAAHPAWWRGQEQASREWSKRLEAMRAENEKLKAASLANSIKLAELEESQR